MSLRSQQPIPPVPDDTARVARAAFRRGNPYMLLRDRLGAVFDDTGFADLYPNLGQPAYAPWRLPDAIAWIMQLLPELHGAVSFARFLPEVAPEPPEYALRCRSAVASTLVAGLELARQGQFTLMQEDSFGAMDVHAVRGAPTAETVVDH